MMNQELEKMGLSETTHFTNCVGIYNDDHYSTPYDMAMILKAAMDNDLCREVLGTRTYTTSKSKPHPDGITISNWFLRRIEDKDTHSEIIGAKTGFVNQSGSCAASMAQTPDGKEYICVTAGSTSSWRCIYDHVDIYDAFLPETAQPFESEEVTQ
jgi:D-alanyl-D-alanine carboxypeptidase (penicillin-binding protein 5/6)